MTPTEARAADQQDADTVDLEPVHSSLDAVNADLDELDQVHSTLTCWCCPLLLALSVMQALRSNRPRSTVLQTTELSVSPQAIFAVDLQVDRKPWSALQIV